MPDIFYLYALVYIFSQVRAIIRTEKEEMILTADFDRLQKHPRFTANMVLAVLDTAWVVGGLFTLHWIYFMCMLLCTWTAIVCRMFSLSKVESKRITIATFLVKIIFAVLILLIHFFIHKS